MAANTGYNMHMSEDKIAAAISRGMTRQQACAALGIAYEAATPAKIDKAALKDMAINTLAMLIKDMNTNPTAHKPNDIIAACREALDRTEGKAVQTTHINQLTTYTINAAIPAPPNSLPYIDMESARLDS
jgi:hypothetical protein